MVKTDDFRKKIADIFIKSLEEEPLIWRKGWNEVLCAPINAVTGARYKGINFFYLMAIALERKYDDLRFATFKQIQSQNWTLNKGSKGINVEYWFPWDVKNNIKSTWAEYQMWLQNSNKDVEIRPCPKSFTVFNASCIKGIPPLEVSVKNDINLAELVTHAAKNMGVEILNDGGNRAFYSIRDDRIHLPKPEQFLSAYQLNSTALHELTHATGAASRLARDLTGRFGAPQYAYEELVAEIGSCFMGIHLQSDVFPMDLNLEEMNQHKAYVKNWISEIREKPEILVKAIRDAELAADYLECKAERITENEYKKVVESSMEVTIQEEKNNIPRLFDALKNKDLDRCIEEIMNIEWAAEPARFDPFGNVLASQEATYTEGTWYAELRFYNTFDPGIINMNNIKKLKTGIELWIKPVELNDMNKMLEIKKIVLFQKESKSLVNSKKNYAGVKSIWRKLTGQDTVFFSGGKAIDYKQSQLAAVKPRRLYVDMEV